MGRLAVYREKWREIPAGSAAGGRHFSDDLLGLSDGDLLSFWNGMEEARNCAEISWVEPLYRDFFSRKPKGRWIELAYPKQRWLREGVRAFDHWGKNTDGDRTPWSEWYDAEKLRARLAPQQFRTILDFSFDNANYHWFDFERI